MKYSLGQREIATSRFSEETKVGHVTRMLVRPNGKPLPIVKGRSQEFMTRKHLVS